MFYKIIDSADVELEAVKSEGKKSDKGHGHKDIITGEGHSLTFRWVTLEPGASGPERDFVLHPDGEEVEYIVYGQGRVLYPDGKTFPLKPGVMVYHSPGQPHRFENNSNEPLIFVVVLGNGKGLRRITYSPSNPPKVEISNNIPKWDKNRPPYYEIIDVSKVDPVVTGTEGQPGDKGHAHKTLLKPEEHSLTFLWIILEPGASGPEKDFVIHPKCEQVEYILYGRGRALYPDGKTFPLIPGVTAYHSAGQPHRFENNSNEPLLFIVATWVGELNQEGRVHYSPDQD